MAASASFGWRYARAYPAVAGPIVLISIDTLRADRLPAYGYEQIPTPAIDALAADGVVFDRAYSHSPQTLPAHASIFTGRLPFEHGVRDNVGFSVKQGERVLARMLRERGFATAGVVSAYVLRKEAGVAQGFDFFDAELPQAAPGMSFAQVQRDGAESVAVADRWLNGQTSPRFFLFVHLYEPHTPYSPPVRFAKYDAYDGEIAYADELVGRLLQSLKDRGLYDKATIILLGDHGEGLGDHGETEHGVFLYDESIRVPLIVKMPRGAGAGRRIAQPVQHIDLAPTILDLVGAPRPGGLRGRTLKPILAGERDTVSEQGIYSEALYSRYHFGWSELYAITDDRYRLIKAPREELYDLQDDPDETRNIVDDRAQTRVALRSALDRLIAGRAIAAPSQVSEEDRERLQALGYVGTHAEVAPDVAGETLADPKDKVGVLERYRHAVALAGERKFAESVAVFRQILADNRGMKDVRLQLANVLVRAGRMREAVEAYKRLLEIDPANTDGLLGAAAGLLKLKKLDEAAQHAEIAARVAPAEDRRARATAYELLAKISLRRRDGDEAHRYATLAQETDPTLPLPIYIQALQLHAAARYAEALPLFEETLRQLAERPVTLTEVHYYAGDTLARLGRNAEAEAAFLQELRLFPQNTRAYAGLAMLYRSLGRDSEVERVVEALTRAVPTSEGYGLAIRLWTMFDDPRRAAAIRAEARRLLGAVPAVDASQE